MVKVLEWNINQRTGNCKEDIPNWIVDEIKSVNADIVVLNEFFKHRNWKEIVENAFEDYEVKCSKNTDIGHNDVLIAIKKCFEITYVDNEVICDSDDIPNYLRVDCKIGEQYLTVIGMRIRMVNFEDRLKEMRYVLDRINNIENSILIAGDFNNNRRGTIEKTWSLESIDKLIFNYGFIRHTPEGSSIYEDYAKSHEYEFAEDHFFTKKLEVEINPYDRTFTDRYTEVYKWGRDFQIYLGRDEYGKDKTKSIPSPYPDHAMLIGDLTLI